MGGSETLILRISNWFIEEGYEVSIICNSCIPYFKVKFNKVGIELVETKVFSYKELKKIIYEICLDRCKKQFFITFNINDFVLAEKILKNKKNSFNYLYILHPLHTIGVGRLEELRKPFYKKILKMAYDGNKLLFMDEDCIHVCEKHYQINLEEEYKRIIRLPMYINKNFKQKDNVSSSFNILTIARFDFSFKGYIIGLIKDFAELKIIYPQITLTIIGDGKGKKEVEECIKILDKKIQKDIFLEGIVPYDKLDIHFKKANVFVGMGTTLLDASNYGLISLTVYSNTYLFLSPGFYYENPQLLGGFESGLVYPKLDGKTLLEKVINMEQSEYQKLSCKSFLALKEMYDIENVMNNLIKNKLSIHKKEKYRVLSLNIAMAINEISYAIRKNSLI